MTRLLESIRRIPGVVFAGATTAIPFGSNRDDGVILAEGHVMRPGESMISPRRLAVTPGYFETMRIALKRGRYFSEHDNESSLPVIIIDEKLAQHFWPNRNPIGQRMYRATKPNAQTDANTKWLTVAGVVRSVRLENLAGTGNTTGAYYFPYAQAPSSNSTFAIKTKGDPVFLERAVRAAVAQVDPELALFDIRTMSERAELSVSSRRTSMILALGFGIAALLLSATGIYGVLAYLVTQRRREIGIRVALGSTSAGVVRLVVREGLTPVIAGLIVGFLGAAALQKTVATQIYGVQPLDPLVMASVILLLGVIAMIGCVVPARRALQVDAVTVLNEQ